MHSALRKMGNSTGLIVPRSVLAKAGVASGTTLDLVVKDGRIVATPVPSVRAEDVATCEDRMFTSICLC